MWRMEEEEEAWHQCTLEQTFNPITPNQYVQLYLEYILIGK